METELSLDTPLQLSHTNLLYWKSNFPQILSLAQAVTEGRCPKGEARTLGPRAPSVPKAKLGHSVRVRHRVLIFRKLYTWVGFNYPPWLGPKNMEPCVSSVPKANL